jgi:hypothetical protein
LKRAVKTPAGQSVDLIVKFIKEFLSVKCENKVRFVARAWAAAYSCRLMVRKKLVFGACGHAALLSCVNQHSAAIHVLDYGSRSITG